MKYALVLIFVAFNVFFIGTCNADSKTRVKRSLSKEICPHSLTYEQCVAYAKKTSEALEACNRYIVNGDTIEWQTCGTVVCGTNTRLVQEDRSKPYPDCCAHCEIIDINKPAETIGIM